MKPESTSAETKSIYNQPALILAGAGCFILLVIFIFFALVGGAYYAIRKNMNTNFNVNTPGPIEPTSTPKPDPIQETLTKEFSTLFPEVKYDIFQDKYISYTIRITEKSIAFVYPKSYHSVFDYCQKIEGFIDESDIFGVYISVTDEENYSCFLANETYKSTGSKSEVFWDLSYKTSEEVDLKNDFYSARYNENYTEAFKLGADLLAMNPSAPNYWDVAFAYYRKASLRGPDETANLKKAEEHYRKSIEADPEFAPGYASLPVIQQLQMKPMKYTTDMDKSLEKAKQLDPGWSFAWMNKGEALALVGRFSEAYAEEKKAVEANPKFPDQGRIIRNFICITQYTGKKETQEFYDKYEITKEMLKSGC